MNRRTFQLAAACAAVLVAASACNPFAPRKLYSQGDEELIIREFFADRRGGTFLDVGSYHWQEYSTTYYLEKHLGWTGIAIDAQADLAEDYRKHRPGTRFFSYAVTDHSGDTLKLHLAWGLSSLRQDWLNKTTGQDLEQRTVEVPTITLDDLLAREGVTHMDFLSMDIEGAEMPALAAFDIERYRPELVCIESDFDHRARMMLYFERHGYERIVEPRDYTNWYFRPRRTTAS